MSTENPAIPTTPSRGFVFYSILLVLASPLLALAIVVVADVPSATGREAADAASPGIEAEPDADASARDRRTVPAYPPTEAREVKETLHGVEIVDPYRYMEETGSDEVRAWARAEDALVGELLDQTEAYRRHADLLERLTDLERWGSAASQRGDRLFVARTEGVGINGLTYLVREKDGSLCTLVDSRKLFPGGERRVSSARSIAPDGTLLAYGTARTGSRWLEMQLITVETECSERSSFALETLDGLHTSMARFGWVRDAEAPAGWGFYYARLPKPEKGREMAAKPEGARLFYHRVGTEQIRDRLVHDPEDPRSYLVPTVTDDGRYLVLRSGRAGESSTRFRVRDLEAEGSGWIDLAAIDEGSLLFVGNSGSRFFFRTDRGASRGRVVAIEPGNRAWQEIVPEADRAVIQNVNLVADRLIVLRMDVSLPRVAVHDLEGKLERRVELPVIGMPWSGFAGRAQDGLAYFGLSTVVDPGSIYSLDPRTGEVETVLRTETPVDPSSIVIRQVEYPSGDGTSVPMFLAHRRDLDLEKPQPVFMYGYGAYAWVAFPWFQPHVVAFMEAGGIYALPGIRGGGEHGEPWHEAGKARNKERTIADFLAAAEWLVKQGITEPSKLVANGGSASGVVAAAAALRRPELFGAAIVDIPALDMVRHEQSPRGGYWVPEFGSAEDPEDFAALHAYSPYHALRPGRCLPPTLLTVGERDEITPPWHGYKFTAKAQALARAAGEEEEGCSNEILLQVVWGEGHGFGTTSEQSVRTWARQLAFLERAIGL